MARRSPRSAKTQKTIFSLVGIIVSVLFIWIFLFSVWYSNNINNKTNFVNHVTEVLETETVRTAISNEIIDVVKQRRPLVGEIAAPVLSNVITGVLDTNMFAGVYSRMAGELHLQLTTKNPRPLIIDVKQAKQFIEPLISSQDDSILNSFPDQIVIIKENQIPSLYLFGPYLGILGPASLIAAFVILGLIWAKTKNKRAFFIKLFLTISASGVLVYFLIPTIGTYLISQFQSVNLSIIVSQVYSSFTDPIVKTAMLAVVIGIIGAIFSKWLNRDILRSFKRGK